MVYLTRITCPRRLADFHLDTFFIQAFGRRGTDYFSASTTCGSIVQIAFSHCAV